MLMPNSDLSSSILSPSPLIPNSVETLDESSSPIDAIGENDDQESLSTVASIPPPNSDGSPSTSLNEALTVPPPVSLDHGECNGTQAMPESANHPLNSFPIIGSASEAAYIDEDIWDGACVSNLPDDRQVRSPNVSPGYDTDDESSMDYWRQPSFSFEQEPRKIIEPQIFEPTGVGAGLWNLGNTCFVNSVLQCFTHTVPLIQSLRSYKFQDSCNCGNENFCVIRALRGHLDVVLRTSRYSVSPFFFVQNLDYFSPDFRPYQQEDAHEFLQEFLDKLERCCLDRRSDSDYIRTSQDFNIVEHVFRGRLVSELRCCNCNSVSETYENSLGMSLEIEDVDNLWSALESFTCVEKLEEQMTCDNCKEKVSKEKHLLLDRLPLIATFHLKRFKNNGFFMGKIFNKVEFPLELDLAPYMSMSSSQNNQVPTKYRLYAFVEHLGSLAYGHYCSYVRSAPKTWHKFDDLKVTRIDEDSVLSRDSYILFYAREGTPWFSTIYEEMHPLLEASLQNSSPQSTNGECSSEISYEHVDKSNRPCYSAGVSNPHVKTEEDFISLSNESNEDMFLLPGDSSVQDSSMAELLDSIDPDIDSYNPYGLELYNKKEPDSCLAIERAAATGDDFLPLLMAQNQDSSEVQTRMEHLESRKNQEEELCKQPLLINDIAESNKTEIAHRQGLMKKPSHHARELDQAIATTDSTPKKPKTA